MTRLFRYESTGHRIRERQNLMVDLCLVGADGQRLGVRSVVGS